MSPGMCWKCTPELATSRSGRVTARVNRDGCRTSLSGTARRAHEIGDIH